jgi:hypothetical protein
MQPINYMLDVQSPFQSALQGYQAGSQIQAANVQRQQAQLAVQQQHQEIERQQRLQEAYQAAADAPTAANLSRLMLLDPKSSEAINRSWTVRNNEQQQSLASDLMQWGAAIKSGKPEIAAQRLNERADAMERENGGLPTQESQALRLQAKMAVEAPDFALGQIEAMLAANPKGKEAADTLASFGAERRAAAMAPVAQRRAEAEATTAEVAAKYAESQAVQDLALKGWNIKALEADMEFKRQSARIAAMNASIAREGNAIRKQELQMKLAEAVSARDSKLREKVATAEAGAANIDNMLNTVERIRRNPSLGDVVGSLEGRLPGAVISGFDDEEADAIALIDTLGSQAFLAQIPNIKGMGALSNAEGEKLQAALQNLSRAQSEKQFRANLDEASRLLNKGRETLSKSSGVPLGKPDTPAAPGSRPPLDSFFR